MALSHYAVNTECSGSSYERTRDRWTIVLLGSTMLSVLAGLGGLVMSTAPWFFAEDLNGLRGPGTVLLIALFPLLFLAAHSLDKINEAEKALGLERCRRTGLKD